MLAVSSLVHPCAQWAITDAEELDAELSPEEIITYQETYLNTDDPFTSDTDQEGQRVTNPPRHKANWGARFTSDKGFSVCIVGHYVGPTFGTLNLSSPLEMELKDYVLLNAQSAYPCYKQRIEVALSGFKPLHDKHKEYPLEEEIRT